MPTGVRQPGLEQQDFGDVFSHIELDLSDVGHGVGQNRSLDSYENTSDAVKEQTAAWESLGIKIPTYQKSDLENCHYSNLPAFSKKIHDAAFSFLAPILEEYSDLPESKQVFKLLIDWICEASWFEPDPHITGDDVPYSKKIDLFFSYPNSDDFQLGDPIARDFVDPLELDWLDESPLVNDVQLERYLGMRQRIKTLDLPLNEEERTAGHTILRDVSQFIYEEDFLPGPQAPKNPDGELPIYVQGQNNFLSSSKQQALQGNLRRLYLTTSNPLRFSKMMKAYAQALGQFQVYVRAFNDKGVSESDVLFFLQKDSVDAQQDLSADQAWAQSAKFLFKPAEKQRLAKYLVLDSLPVASDLTRLAYFEANQEAFVTLKELIALSVEDLPLRVEQLEMVQGDLPGYLEFYQNIISTMILDGGLSGHELLKRFSEQILYFQEIIQINQDNIAVLESHPEYFEKYALSQSQLEKAQTLKECLFIIWQQTSEKLKKTKESYLNSLALQTDDVTVFQVNNNFDQTISILDFLAQQFGDNPHASEIDFSWAIDGIDFQIESILDTLRFSEQQMESQDRDVSYAREKISWMPLQALTQEIGTDSATEQALSSFLAFESNADELYRVYNDATAYGKRFPAHREKTLLEESLPKMSRKAPLELSKEKANRVTQRLEYAYYLLSYFEAKQAAFDKRVSNEFSEVVIEDLAKIRRELNYGWPQKNGLSDKGYVLFEDFAPRAEQYLGESEFNSLLAGLGSEQNAIEKFLKFIGDPEQGFVRYFVYGGQAFTSTGVMQSYLNDLSFVNKFRQVLSDWYQLLQEQLKTAGAEKRPSLEKSKELIAAALYALNALIDEHEFSKKYWAQIEQGEITGIRYQGVSSLESDLQGQNSLEIQDQMRAIIARSHYLPQVVLKRAAFADKNRFLRTLEWSFAPNKDVRFFRERVHTNPQESSLPEGFENWGAEQKKEYLDQLQNMASDKKASNSVTGDEKTFASNFAEIIDTLNFTNGIEKQITGYDLNFWDWGIALAGEAEASLLIGEVASSYTLGSDWSAKREVFLKVIEKTPIQKLKQIHQNSRQSLNNSDLVQGIPMSEPLWSLISSSSIAERLFLVGYLGVRLADQERAEKEEGEFDAFFANWRNQKMLEELDQMNQDQKTDLAKNLLGSFGLEKFLSKLSESKLLKLHKKLLEIPQSRPLKKAQALETLFADIAKTADVMRRNAETGAYVKFAAYSYLAYALKLEQENDEEKDWKLAKFGDELSGFFKGVDFSQLNSFVIRAKALDSKISYAFFVNLAQRNQRGEAHNLLFLSEKFNDADVTHATVFRYSSFEENLPRSSFWQWLSANALKALNQQEEQSSVYFSGSDITRALALRMQGTFENHGLSPKFPSIRNREWTSELAEEVAQFLNEQLSRTEFVLNNFEKFGDLLDELESYGDDRATALKAARTRVAGASKEIAMRESRTALSLLDQVFSESYFKRKQLVEELQVILENDYGKDMESKRFDFPELLLLQ
ncbi:MAG: hypothetical protein H7A33_00465 [Deltaproteobacteria bacterium]|nr:hypothetical protein [Deltaproteobacteria bacterium]